MNTNTTTTPTQVVAPAETATTISQSKPNEGVTYNEGNGVVDTIVMTGPLSEIYTRALGVYFAKKPLDGSVLASESQAMDTVRNAVISDSLDAGLKEIADAVVLQTPAEVISNPDATVFAVDYSQVNRPEVIDAMERLRTRAKASGMDYVFVVHVDPLTQSAPVYDGYNKMLPLDADGVAKTDLSTGVFSRATENYCESLGFPMVYGMEGFANWLINKYKGKQSYSQEGFLEVIKSIFGFKKKKEELTENEQQKLVRLIGVAVKYLKNFQNKSWVQSNCVVSDNPTDNKELLKFITNAKTASVVLSKLEHLVNKANGDNLKLVPKLSEKYGNDDLSFYLNEKNGFVNMSDLVDKGMMDMPKDFGLGIKLVKDPGHSYPQYKLSGSPDFKDSKLSLDEIVKVSEIIEHISSHDPMSTDWFPTPGFEWEFEDELQIHFNINWRNHKDQTAEELLSDKNLYLDTHQAFDIFNISHNLTNIVDQYLVLLATHIKRDNDGDHEHR